MKKNQFFTKFYIFSVIYIVLLSAHNCTYSMQTTTLTLLTIGDNSINRQAGYTILCQTSYTTGGVTFTYPTDTFTETPTVGVAIEIASPTLSDVYIAEITANSSTSTTVNVYMLDLTGVSLSDAPDDSVTVHLIAAGI